MSPAIFILTTLLGGLILVAASTLFMLCQPWLGLRFDGSADRGIRVVSAYPAGPSAQIAEGTILTALGNGARDTIQLVPFDVVEDPDTAPTYAAFDIFLDRQSQIAGLLRSEHVRLTTAAGDEIVVRPASSRPIASLPGGFWLQQFVGLACLIMGAWAYSLKRHDPAVRLLALASIFSTFATWASAIFIYRELALEGSIVFAMSSLNFAGSLGFAASIFALFLVYPRRLVPLSVIILIVSVTVVAWVTDLLRIGFDTPAMQRYLLISLMLVGSLIAASIQYVRAAGNPLTRTALKWFGLALGVGVAMFILAHAAPVLTGRPVEMPQAIAYAFALVMNGGLAVAVVRYRLFELDAWAFRILFYTGGMLLLVAIDATLIAILHLHQASSFGIALLAVGFIYLPLRGKLWDRFVTRKCLEEHELFQAVINVSFATSAPERSERWRELLQRLFHPLAIEHSDRTVDAAQIRHEGLEMLLPAAADSPALVIRYPWRGQRLFGATHQKLASELVRMMRYVEDSRNAYVRGSLEERRRIARDLHDDVGARLLSGLYKTDLSDTQRVLRDAIADIRTIVSGLSTDQPLLGQMIAALRHESSERLTAAGLELTWPIAEVDDAPLPLNYLMYRSLTSAHREIISNIIRHANARNVSVRVREAKGWLSMVIIDDGIGINPAYTSGSPQGNGISGLILRIGELHGTVSIRPLAKGTSVEITMPFRADAAIPPAKNPRQHRATHLSPTFEGY